MAFIFNCGPIIIFSNHIMVIITALIAVIVTINDFRSILTNFGFIIYIILRLTRNFLIVPCNGMLMLRYLWSIILLELFQVR